MLNALLQLFEHSYWANCRTYSAIETTVETSDTAIQLLEHIVTTETIYLSRMKGEDPFPQDFWPKPDLESLNKRIEYSFENITTFIQEREEEELLRSVQYRNSKGVYFETRLDQMLLHVSLHGEHHRGQIARIIRQKNGEPAMTDYIVFVRGLIEE